jgi:predicted nucleic-acid-binding protein
VQLAIDAFARGKGRFADQLIAQVGFSNGADGIITFDIPFAKAAKVRRL